MQNSALLLSQIFNHVDFAPKLWIEDDDGEKIRAENKDSKLEFPPEIKGRFDIYHVVKVRVIIIVDYSQELQQTINPKFLYFNFYIL